MEFASTHVYNYANSDEEAVSDDEFEQGITLSDDEDIAEPESTGEEDVVYDNDSITEPENATRRKGEKDVVYDNVEVSPRKTSFFSSIRQKFGGALSSGRELSERSGQSKQLPRKKKTKTSHWRSTPNYDYQRNYCELEPEAERWRKYRRADTNVVSIKFGTLKKPSNMHTGDPSYCMQCTAVLSHLSKMSQEDGDQVWKCEYCGQLNQVDLMAEEVPSTNDVTFMLEPAPTTMAAGPAGTDESLVVFCVDISGSMCVSTQVPGTAKLRFPNRMKSFNTGNEDQYLPSQRRDVTYISRLQCVQAAISHQLVEMEKDHSHRRVGLVAFNNEVMMIGDGSELPVTVAGDKLTNKDQLVNTATDLKVPGCLKDTRKTLTDKLFELEEGGGTALGPALILSVAMASATPGSKVIICTDGLANVGLGRLDHDESLDASEEFFTDLASYAVDKGISVSVISIKGQDCKMVELGKVADSTGGQVNIVDPLKLTSEFGSILADPVIATNVSATFLMHKGLYIRHEERQDSKVTKLIGNVTAKAEITFEYGVRRHHKKVTLAPCVSIIPEETSMKIMETETIPDTSGGTSVDGDVPPASSDDTVGTAAATGGVSDGNTKMTTGEAPAAETTEITGVVDETSPTVAIGATCVTDKTDVTGPPGGATGTTSVTDETSLGGASASVAGSSGEASCGATGGTAADVDSDIDTLNELPFQLQITYTDLEGGKALRIISQVKPVTKQREVAEKALNIGVLGAHTAHTSAGLALRGDYTTSRLHSLVNQRLISRHTRSVESSDKSSSRALYHGWAQNVAPLEAQIRSAQQQERSNYGRTHSDDEDEEVSPRYARSNILASSHRMSSPRAVAKSVPRGKMFRSRKKDCSDDLANLIYQQKQVRSEDITSTTERKDDKDESDDQ